jgi:histidinol-phosphate aminotransferase
LERELRARLGSDISLLVEVTDRFLTNADGKTPPILHRPGARSVEEMAAYVSSAQVAWSLDRQGEQVYKCDQNEAERLPAPAVVEALRAAISNPHSVCWYPEPGSESLLDTIGTYAGVTGQEVILTHGSDLALELIATTFIRSGDRTLLIWPSYDNLRAVVEQHGAETSRFDFAGDVPFPLQRFEQVVREEAPRMVYLANPNMPLGYTVSRETVSRILDCCARFSALLLVDEAYYEFCGVSVADMVRHSSNLLVTRTFSKAFGLAGLRLGYILAGGHLGRILKSVQNPRSVTTLATAAVAAAFSQLDSVKAYVEEVRESRENIYRFFDEHGITYRRSYGNFILFECERPKELIQYLASSNILVRDCSRFFGGRGHVRVTVAGAVNTRAFLSGMSEYYSARPVTQGARTAD